MKEGQEQKESFLLPAFPVMSILKAKEKTKQNKTTIKHV